MAGTPTPSLILQEYVEGTGRGERVGTRRMDRVAVAPGGCGDKRGRKFLPQFPTPKGEVIAQPGDGATRRLGCYRPTPGGLETKLTPPRPRIGWGGMHLYTWSSSPAREHGEPLPSWERGTALVLAVEL